MPLVNSILEGKPVIHSKTLDEDIIHLGAMTYKLPDNMSYKIYKVDKAHIARPDLISMACYGTDRYGDLICKVNNIPNPFEINEGDIIVIPDVSSIVDFNVVDKFNDDPVSEAANKPRPKARTEKRKANEAVIGDTRFKIDKDRRVIIY